jgi:integrase
MAALMPRLNRSPKGFFARKVIPADVRAEYAVRFGMEWEEKFRLSGPVSEHEAKARFGEWIADIETRIAQLRAAKQGGPRPLTRQNAYALAGRWYRWFIARHEKDLRTPAHWKALSDIAVWEVIRPHAPEEYELRPGDDLQWDWKSAPAVREAIRPQIAASAGTAVFLREQAISLTPDATVLFIDAVSDSYLDALNRLEDLSRGSYAPDGTLAAFPQYEEIASRCPPGATALGLFTAWAKSVQPASSTFDRWVSIFNAANSHFPDVVELDFVSAKAWMAGLVNEKRSAHTVATVWRTALKTVFAWGVNEQLIRSNPFPEIKISTPRRNIERETKAFTADEAKTILTAALQCDDTKSFDERVRRWVPWVCAYSGARAGEITQLRGIDIQKRGSEFFARLSPSAGKIKTRKARTIPLHEHLVTQGFITFAERANGAALFYDVERKRGSSAASSAKRPRQSPAERARGRLGQWVRKLGVADPELSPNHAWRHTFKAQAARVGIDERYSDAITGHTPATTGRAYTKPLPEDLAEAMKKFPRYKVD